MSAAPAPARAGAIRPLDLVLMLTVMVIWGFNFAVAKTALLQFPSIWLIALRYALVALLLVFLVPRPTGKWRQVFVLSVVLGVLHFCLMFTGLRYVDAATAAIAIQLQVPFAALLAALAFGERLGRRQAVGMAIAFAGVAVIAGGPRMEGSLWALGLVITAACLWAVSNLLIKKMGAINGMTLNAWIAVFATPQLAIASLVLEDGQMESIRNADWIGWGAIVYQAVAVVVIGYGLWYWLLRRYQMNQAMPMTLLVPLFGVLSGVLALGEPLTLALLVGGAMTVVGVGLIVLNVRWRR